VGGVVLMFVSTDKPRTPFRYEPVSVISLVQIVLDLAIILAVRGSEQEDSRREFECRSRRLQTALALGCIKTICAPIKSVRNAKC
jgi:hypothetical protein